MKKLRQGELAPTFTITDVTGAEVELETVRGRKVMISFYRYASCPFCNLRVHQLVQRWPELKEQGLEMLAFFQSPAESIAKYVDKHNAPFPIIPDPDHTIYKQYKVQSSLGGFIKSGLKLGKLYRAIFKKKFRMGKMEGNKTLVPADFLINPDGTIHTAFYGKDISDHLPLEAIYAFLREA